MASISAINALTTGSSVLSGALTALGINGWRLSDGSYNGCTFASFVKIPILENSPIIQNGENLIAAINEISGVTSGLDPNGIFNLYNTILGSLQLTAEPIFNIAEKKLPFANRCNTENMGTGGYVFRMVLLFLGSDYIKAKNNFLNAISYTPTNPAIALSLIHPTMGKIPGITRVTKCTVDETVSTWNAAMVNITFRSEQTFKGVSPVNQLQNFTNALQSALGIALGITSATSDFLAIVNSNGRIPTGQTSNVTFTKSKNIADGATDISKSLVANANFVYKTSGTTAVNSSLNSVKIDYSLLPPTLNQVINYAPIQQAIISNYYIKKVQALKDIIAVSGFGSNTNQLTNQLDASIGSLNSVATLALPATNTLSYTVPYVMSLRTVLVNNRISLTQALRVYLNNPQILSPNYIAEGTIIVL